MGQDLLCLWTYWAVLCNNSLFLTKPHTTLITTIDAHINIVRDCLITLRQWIYSNSDLVRVVVWVQTQLYSTTVLSDEPASTIQPIPQSTRQPDEWLGGSHILTCLQPDIIFMKKNYFDVISHDHLGVNLIQPEIRPTCLNSCSALYEPLPLPFHFVSDFY